MKADLLRVVGPVLHGPHWVAALAPGLGVTPRTVNRWLLLDAMPDDIPLRLRPLVKAHVDRALEVRKLLWSSLGEVV